MTTKKAPAKKAKKAPAKKKTDSVKAGTIIKSLGDQKGRLVHLTALGNEKYSVSKPRTQFVSDALTKDEAEAVFQQQRLNPHNG